MDIQVGSNTLTFLIITHCHLLTFMVVLVHFYILHAICLYLWMDPFYMLNILTNSISRIVTYGSACGHIVHTAGHIGSDPINVNPILIKLQT